ncbi:hypothetical protein QL285_004224 [Trifolium repens]|jgi:hypothetical protein|nr:hypothetical protein QL285_004224 [Trifolium repens]
MIHHTSPSTSSSSPSSSQTTISGYDLMKSLTAIAFVILGVNCQVFLLHLNASVIPPSSSNLTANTTTATATTTGKSLQELFSLHHHAISVTLLTINVFGFNLMVTHSLRAPNEVLYNILAIGGVGYTTYQMAKVYSSVLSMYLGILSLFSMAVVILSLSDRFRGIYLYNHQRITNILRRCIKAGFQDQLLPVSVQEHSHVP